MKLIYILLLSVALTGFVTQPTPAVTAQSPQAQACEGAGGQWERVDPADPAAGFHCVRDGEAADIESIILTISNILLSIVAAVAVIMLIIGGIRYILSGGSQEAVQGAKNTILYAIIGIVVVFLSFAAVRFVITGLT